MKLSQLANGRDNNFNLIRFIAAFAVLITHSFALATGDPNTEPLSAILGISLGSIAVDIFFVTSGFLVTASILNRKNIFEFILARFLRIFPALWVMLVVTVFFLGPIVTTLSLNEYVFNSSVYLYLLKCSTLFFGVSHYLPGVFLSNPYKGAVNGSLWSMPHELRMYFILAILWFFVAIFKIHTEKIFKFFVLIIFLISGLAFFVSNFESSDNFGRFIKLLFMFFSGAAFYVLKENVELKTNFFLFLVTIIVLTLLFCNSVFLILYKLTIPYLTLYLAYVPEGIVRKFNQLGDYSYGLYIYAFPIQQAIEYFAKGISISGMVILSGIITLVISVFSWHFIERPALRKKDIYTEYAKKFFPSNI